MDHLKLLFRKSNLILSCLVCCLSQSGVQEKPHLVLSNNGGTLDLSTRGVEAESCTNMVYQVKGCQNHGFQLRDGDRKGLIAFYIGTWRNKKSRLLVPPTGTDQLNQNTRSVLNCNEFRWFWMSWGGGRIKYGKGKLPGKNTIFNRLDSTGRLVKKMALLKIAGAGATIKLGDESGRARFARVLKEGKFSDGLISETSTSRGSCASLCSKHVNCGMFSYSSDLGLCAIFDRMTSSFTVTSEIGWTSWKLLYCNP